MSDLIPIFKSRLRIVWRKIIRLIISLNTSLRDGEILSQPPKVFYAGAITGSRGGPRVKVTRLKKHFPQSLLRFNAVYVLSNYSLLDRKDIELLKKSRTPIILNQNGVYWPGWYGTGWSAKNSPNALIYENSDYVFWQSNFAREAARNFLAPLDPKGEILYNAVDLYEFFPASERSGGNEFTFLVAGNFTLSTFYQVESALEAFSILKKKSSLRIGLKIAGLTSLLRRKSLEFATELGIAQHVTLIGKFNQDQAPDLLRSVDAYLALKYMDTCPNLVIEALACGLPIIFSNTGGTKELVDESCGIGLFVQESWISRPTAPESSKIASAMEEIIPKSKDMGWASRVRAEENFGLTNWYHRHEVVFHNISSEKRGNG